MGNISKGKKTYTVFISSTFIDNEDRRKVVEDAILRAEMRPVGMERFSASHHPTVEECERQARGCDIYLGIIAYRYGWIPDGKPVSITELEYNAAKAAGRPRLMFEIDRSILVHPDKDYDQGPDRWCKQKLLDAFQAKYRQDQMPAPFKETTLSGMVVHALTRWREEQDDLEASALIGLLQRPWRLGISPPGALLRADIEGAVPFHGRHDEVSSIETWCDAAKPIGVRLYTGAGGMGKTRLFIEMCQRLRAQRWRAGFLDHRAASAPTPLWSKLVNHPDPLFLVLDYAETRPEELTILLREVFELSAEPRVRIVLLARAADDWWDQLKTEREGVGDLLTGPATQWFSLGPLALTTEDRYRSYRMALTTFGNHLKPEKPPSDDPPKDLDSKIFKRVLLLHMSALAAIDGVPVKGDQGILDYVLQRERRFWSERAEAKGLSPDIVPGIAQAMAVLRLGGGARTKAEAVAVFKQISLLKDQKAAVLNGISTLLHETYPGEKWIEPILPDLLGEHLVQIEVKKDPDALFDLVFGAREADTVVSPEH